MDTASGDPKEKKDGKKGQSNPMTQQKVTKRAYGNDRDLWRSMTANATGTAHDDDDDNDDYTEPFTNDS